jgi:hypothetical protein
MTNIKANVTGNILTVVVDLSERHGRSASGKTEMIATTAGNQSVPGFPDIKMGINVYTK